ncbi:AAA family ATPase [Desulfoluna sp.]|uniref:protein kinase domain-containing protein n=1 Tax=Desulfoluna sp. TaxID=2045199 RepID=UPI002636A293|nr:AAA family ATPase [Desulfoluna sp.]
MAVIDEFVQPKLVFQDGLSGYYKAWSTEHHRNVILKVLKRECPSDTEMEMYKQECVTLQGLEHPGVMKAIELKQTSLGLTLSLEDIGGEQLKRIYEISTPGHEALLSWFQTLAHTLSYCHRCGVVHGNITPYYIVVNIRTGQVQLAGFHNNVCLGDVNSLRNIDDRLMALAYSAPELKTTGGLHSDPRSDLYSLGVMMYEAFTGRLPFEVETLGGIIHSQVAVAPLAPSKICLDIPPWLDEVIMRLIDRNPAGRFDSAGALSVALENGIRTGESSGHAIDTSQESFAEEPLCGREEEKRVLVAWLKGLSESGSLAFERPGVMLLSGEPGAGKTTLAEWVCCYARRHYPDVMLVSGKFDQDVDRPGSVFIGVLQQVARSILGEPEAKLWKWRNVVNLLMGDGASTLSAIVPDFSLITGKEPDERFRTLEASAKANVIRLSMINLFRVFKRMDRPLILFIDDIQWADEDSHLFLNLLTEMVGEKVGLLGALRTQAGQSLRMEAFFDTARLKNEGKADVLLLQGLDSLAVETFLVLHLREDRKRIAPLADLFYAKTGGNPYHLNALLEKVLYGGGLVRAHGPDGEGWYWNQQKLEALPVSNTAALWISERVDRLDTPLKQLVEAASLLGHRVVPSLLCLVVQTSEAEVRQGLECLCEEKIFVHVKDGDYRFVHDLVQKSAYDRMNQSQRALAHFNAGMHMYEGLQRRPGRYLFDVVYQFNASGTVPVRESYRKELVLLNLSAGKRSMETSSFGQALDFFRSGLRLFGEGAWLDDYGVCLDITSAAAEAAYALGEYAVMEGYVATVEQKAKSDFDCVGVWRMRIRGAIAVNDLTGALSLGRKALSKFGFRLPETVTRGHQMMAFLRVRSHLVRLGRRGLDRLHSMTDAGHLSIMELLFTVIMASYLAGTVLSSLIIFSALRYSLKHGRSKYTPFLLVTYGVICIRVDKNVDKGMVQVQAALDLMDKKSQWGGRGKTLVVIICLIRHWKEPIHKLLPMYLQAYEQSLAEGDNEYAGSAVSAWLYSRFFSSGELHQLARDMVVYVEEMERLKLPFLRTVRNLQQTVVNLTEAGDYPMRFSGPFFTDEERPRGGDMPNDHTAALNYHITKGFMAFLFGDDALALHHVECYTAMMDEGTSTYTIPVFSAFVAAIFARYGGGGITLKQKAWRKKAKRIEAELKKAAVDAPENFSHLHVLVQGERALAQKKLSKAAGFFEHASEVAKKHNFTFHEAYALERAGFCYLKMGWKRLARVCLTDAVNLWRFWGAEAKALKLEKDYEEVLRRLPAIMDASHGHVPIDACPRTVGCLNLEGVSKAFEALSTERTLNHFVEKLMLTALEYGGAEAGAVLRMDGELVRLVAWKGEGAEEVELCGSVPLTDSADLPSAMIQYVARTGRLLQYNHGTVPVAYDPYFDDFQGGSAICIPSRIQSRLCGALYLENRTVDHLFEGQRLRVLNTLSSQIANAMESTRLYESQENQAENLHRVNLVLKNETADRKNKELALLEKERELNESGEKLREANITLKQMLSKSDENMAEIQENMIRNVDDLIFPYIERLKGTRLTQVQGNLVGMLEKNIEDLLSPFARKLNAGFYRLTPAEIQTAQLVRSGKTTKEIADVLNLSPRTIEAYRDSIRDKLGLKKSGVNLRVYLMQM